MNLPAFECFTVSFPAPHVAQVAMTSGRRGNPVGVKFLEELGPVFDAVSANSDVRAVMFVSPDKDFSFGLDLIGVAPAMMQMVSTGEAGRDEIVRTGALWQQALTRIAECRVPVVVAVTGWCIGAGLELIAACDVRFCSADALFSLREVKVGIVSDLGGLQRLPNLVSHGWMRQMAFTGDDFSAVQALQMGLINTVLDTPNLAREAALALAVRIANNPPRVVAGIKQVLNAQTEAHVQKSLTHALALNAELFQTKDFMEAMMAAMQKRQPVYSGN